VSAAKTRPAPGATVQSLRDIMQHEEQLQQQQFSAGQRSSTAAASSWVAKAARGLPSTNWNNPALSSGPAIATSNQILPMNNATAISSKLDASSSRVEEGEQFWNFKDFKQSHSAGPADPSRSAPPAQEPYSARPYAQSTEKKNSTELGGMNSEMAEWCTQQLRRLANNDDLTLVQFCLTLESPVEVREYLAAYLGSTPQVTT